MAKKQILDHKVHKYFRKRVGDKARVIYACAYPGCTTYQLPEMTLGKLSVCWSCKQPFLLTDKLKLLIAKPWCEECSATRKKKLVDDSVLQLVDLLAKGPNG